MSGIETVGLVLAAIPLIISTLEHYQDSKGAVSTWRQHVRVAQSLVRNLKTEHGKLRNTCETLLGGIVSPAMLEPMLNSPFGPQWEDEGTRELIKRRLDHMYKAFEETVSDMIAIMHELKSNLGLNDQDQPEWYASGTVKRTVMRASFVIKRSSYNDTLQELISKNQTLETIVVGSIRLEPSRRNRTQIKYIGLFRRIIRSMYKALRLDLCGTCPEKHKLSLQLLTPPRTWRADEDSIVAKLDFRVILSHHAGTLVGSSLGGWTWKEVKLKVASPPGILKDGDIPHGSPLIQGSDMTRSAKHVNFSMETYAHTANSQAVGHTLSVDTQSKPPPDSLCLVLSRNNTRQTTCGYVVDPSVAEYGRFGVYHMDGIPGSGDLAFISIRDMMEKPNCLPSLPQKLTLGYTIVSGILQLHDTPWLSAVVTGRTLYLARYDTTVSFNRVYIARAEPEDPSHDDPLSPGPSDNNTNSTIPAEIAGNELIWELYVLLVEVIFWQPMDDFLSERCPNTTTAAAPREIFNLTTRRGFETVRDLLSQVTMVGGREYCGAVERCLNLAFGYPDLDLGHEEIQQQICGKIITPIEESAQSAERLTTAIGGFDIHF
ncbi:hypothetical protein F4802DRAFT_583081 [Xylaria palmicola]|nr:hypothetical protein F4802DRAFT_583081 [Xylaria palmicola]